MNECYKCIHRRSIPGNKHSACNNMDASVRGNPRGIDRGWFNWPFNFDPVWLEKCDGFSDDPQDSLPEKTNEPMFALLSLLK